MNKVINGGTVLVLLLLLSSCRDNSTSGGEGLPKTLEPIENVSLIPGGENVTIVVNMDEEKEAYFNIEFKDIKPNDIIENGIREGWCIDYRTPLNSNNGTYENIKLYSTYLVEDWMPVNYLLNVKEQLQKDDPDLTWREIQLAIWSLSKNPVFDLENVNLEDLPRAMRTNGQPNFSYEKVKEVVNFVEDGYKKFRFSEGTKFVVIVETPADVQTLITVVE